MTYHNVTTQRQSDYFSGTHTEKSQRNRIKFTVVRPPTEVSIKSSGLKVMAQFLLAHK